MKISNTHEEAFVSKNVETHSATISITPEVFDLMISGIYQDKVAAPSRELICNARDSHVEAGVDLPIKIHAPTALEPWFSVQDFGLGMSREMTTQTFMCLGSSTKRDSNELIGAKGIGSKSPFAITDAFQVCSVFNGVQTAYSIFKDKGLPKIAVIHEKETEDHNGVEVKFSIDPNLINSFNERLLKFLTYFNYRYTLNIEVPKKQHIAFEGTYEDFVVKIQEDSSVRSRVVMGGVPYKSSFLDKRYGYDNIIVEVPIGACDVDPGREWTVEDHNSTTFRDKLISAVQHVEEQYKIKIQSELQQFSKITDSVDWYKGLSHSAKSLANETIYEKMGCKGSKLSYYTPRSSRFDRSVIGVSSLLHGKTIFMIRDCSNKVMLRAKKLMEEQDKDFCFLLNNDNHITTDPLFEGLVFRATDVILPKDKKSREKVEYERQKGHRVFVIRKGQSGFSIEQVSKEDIESCQSWLLRGPVTKYSHATRPVAVVGVGLMNFSRETNCDEMLDYVGVEEIYLLTENQAKWVDNHKRFKIKPDDGLIKMIINNQVQKNSYNKYVEIINKSRKILDRKGSLKYLEDTRLPRWIPSCVIGEVQERFKTDAKAQQKQEKVKIEAENLQKEVDNLFPLLAKLNHVDYNHEHVKEYIQAMKLLKKGI